MLNQSQLKKINLELELPLEWIDKVEQLAQQNEQSLAEIIVELIGKNLGLDVENLKYNRLLKEYQELEKRLVILENKDYQIDKLNHRLEITEKLINQIQTQKFSYRPQRINIVTDDDDIEDEPDEILTDFLL